MELTKQDYQSALEIWLSYRKGDSELSFPGYIEVKLDELEQPEEKMYKCIQLPPSNNGICKIGSLYSEHYVFLGFPLSDLPNHFELVEPEPEPEPEKITWHEVKALIQDIVSSGYWPPIPKSLPLIEAINRIKTDHLS